MSTALAIEDEVFVLPAPTPDTPVVLSRWIHPANRHANSLYSALIWSLGPLTDNPSTSVPRILWDKCPQEFRGQLKPPAWTMINGELRATYLQTRGVNARSRRASTMLRETCREWIRLACWLHKKGITDLAKCTDDHWREYVRQRFKSGCTRDHAERILGWLTALWAFDQVSPLPCNVPRPPWDIEGVDDYLPALETSSRAENSREPLDPKVIGPLLVWAVRVIEDLADDILAAWAENRRMTARANSNRTTPEGRAALEAYLRPLIRSGDPLPAVDYKGGKVAARMFIAATTGASLRHVELANEREGLTAMAAQRPGACPLSIPITGRVAGKPWREHIDFYEVPQLMRHLGTAAMIICLYLTGMRPQEGQALRSGCCPDPDPAADGSPGRHLIRSWHFKNVTDDDGNHVSAGEERGVPWVAITPVVRAIRVLERIVPPGEFLFSAAHHDFLFQRGHHGVLKARGLNFRIRDFIAWVNREANALGLPEQTIPKDPHGTVNLARFRRTLAWHIARRPGGLIALAIQYGHMRTVLDARTSSGYGNRSRGGIHSVLDIETALAAADTAAHLRDQVAAGEKVSGPAARRGLSAAAQTPRFAGRIVPQTFARKAAAFLARDGIVLYDNPDALLICAFKHDNALCEPEPGATAPRQYACKSGCGNALRTDTHARQLRKRADEIDRKTIAVPEKLAKRLRRNANNLRAAADAHDATAQSAEALA